ncbi:hypothetical protein [Xanthomonas phaseoli]|uniref:hypothetical protein n=1 Tax=Xanthomonas phaseoli TaxID=1985254 RepID=UPI001ED9242D|nr:hypothetical protein [Xanthomonas phaseoli]
MDERWKRRFIWQLHVFTEEIGFCESFSHVCRLNPNYSLADQDHDAVSEDVLFCNRQAAQVYHQPRMAVLGSDCIAGDAGVSSVTSTEFISVSGPVVTGCRQQLRLSTITRARLFDPMFVSRRIPPADHAFRVER